MLNLLRPALVMTVLLSALTGIAYPLAITGIAQLAFPAAANGSLVQRDGIVVGSALIGQNFETARYFHGRPSATSAPDPGDPSKSVDAPDNAASSAGSNLGPTSAKLVERVRGAVQALGGDPARPVPADAVTTSGSGLDPDISPANALLQAPRVAAGRNLPLATIEALVRAQIQHPALGLFGTDRVNVLALNLALDGLKG